MENTPSSSNPQLKVVSLNDTDIAKIAIAVRQLLVEDFKIIVDEKTQPIIKEIQNVQGKQAKQDDEISQLRAEVTYLKSRCEDLEQHSRKQCIRISGVPETLHENTDKKVIEIATQLGVNLQPNDIMISHRTGKNKPRQIIARIPSHMNKRLLRASKLIKKPTRSSRCLNQSGPYTLSK